MKFNITVVLIVLIAGLLTSCATKFYQVYQVTPTTKMKTSESHLIFEDENCKVSYDLWANGGNIGFSFYNKTDKTIVLDLEQSYFILNGTAYNYFKNREYTRSLSLGSSSTNSASVSRSVTGINYLNLLQTNNAQTSNRVNSTTNSAYSISIEEQKVISIPSKTSKSVTEYSINETLYRDCDLFKYPRKNQIKSKSFSKSESPIVFSNRIAYKVKGIEESKEFENEFYVSGISNYPENEILESKYEVFCDQKSATSTKYFKDVAPNKFYFKYSKGQDTWKH